MPKDCINCQETKSRTEFRKGKTICKKCQFELNDTESLAASESATVISETADEMFTKLTELEKISSKMSDRMDAIEMGMNEGLIKVGVIENMLTKILHRMNENNTYVGDLREKIERGDAIQRIALTTMFGNKENKE